MRRRRWLGRQFRVLLRPFLAQRAQHCVADAAREEGVGKLRPVALDGHICGNDAPAAEVAQLQSARIFPLHRARRAADETELAHDQIVRNADFRHFWAPPALKRLVSKTNPVYSCSNGKNSKKDDSSHCLTPSSSRV